MQSQSPWGSEYFSSRSIVAPSRGSPTKRMPLASAAGPRKSGSDSIELHSETQQPQLMQSDSLWMTSIFARETMFSRSCAWS